MAEVDCPCCDAIVVAEMQTQARCACGALLQLYHDCAYDEETSTEWCRDWAVVLEDPETEGAT